MNNFDSNTRRSDEEAEEVTEMADEYDDTRRPNRNPPQPVNYNFNDNLAMQSPRTIENPGNWARIRNNPLANAISGLGESVYATATQYFEIKREETEVKKQYRKECLELERMKVNLDVSLKREEMDANYKQRKKDNKFRERHFNEMNKHHDREHELKKAEFQQTCWRDRFIMAFLCFIAFLLLQMYFKFM